MGPSLMLGASSARGGFEKNPDFLLISHLISETIQDRAIVTVDRQ